MQAYHRHGLDPSAALRLAQITPEQLTLPLGHITARQMEVLSGAAMQELDDESLGAYSRKLPWGSYGMLARASLTAPNLGVALKRWCRHHRLLVDDVLLGLAVDDGIATLAIDERRALGADGDLLDLAREVALVSTDGNALATYFPKPATAGPSLLAVSAVREAADRGERGHVATVVDGRPAILAFDRIEPVGWTLALIVDEATLLASRSPAVP